MTQTTMSKLQLQLQNIVLSRKFVYENYGHRI